MKAYKWMTEDMKAFYDGYQFHFGWNKQNGRKDGLVCVSGGFHITTEKHHVMAVTDGMYDPRKCRIVRHEIYYRQKDILGKSGAKIRVLQFKILKKKQPIIEGHSLGDGRYRHRIYYPSTASDSTAGGYDNYLDNSSCTATTTW